MDPNDVSSGPLINPNEVMTSRAITIRDPETGAVYVQTQLLQVRIVRFEKFAAISTFLNKSQFLQCELCHALQNDVHVRTYTVYPIIFGLSFTRMTLRIWNMKKLRPRFKAAVQSQFYQTTDHCSKTCR